MITPRKARSTGKTSGRQDERRACDRDDDEDLLTILTIWIGLLVARAYRPIINNDCHLIGTPARQGDHPYTNRPHPDQSQLWQQPTKWTSTTQFRLLRRWCRSRSQLCFSTSLQGTSCRCHRSWRHKFSPSLVCSRRDSECDHSVQVLAA